MKKDAKGILKKLVLMPLLAITLVLGMGVSVVSANSASGKIGNYTTGASSYVYRTSAKASTSFASTGSVTVNSNYSYVNTNTLTTGTISRNKGYYSSCSVSFTAPSNCHSVKINSSHCVSAYGQKWTTNTSAVY